MPGVGGLRAALTACASVAAWRLAAGSYEVPVRAVMHPHAFDAAKPMLKSRVGSLVKEPQMRTTFTLDDDAAALAQNYAQARSLRLGKAVSELIRRASAPPVGLKKKGDL